MPHPTKQNASKVPHLPCGIDHVLGVEAASMSKTIPLTDDWFTDKIVPSTSGNLVATRQIVQCFAIRGTEAQVDPPTPIPQVAEANTETELAVTLRATFHVMRHERR